MKKSKAIKNVLFAILAGAAITGCGAFKEASKDVREETEKRADLRGDWKSDCHPSTVMAGKFAILEYNFSPTQTFTHTMDVYSDDGCKAHEASLAGEGTYSLPGDVKEGSQEMDVELTDLTLTPRSEEEANRYNADSQCGFTDWQSGNTKSIKGTECAAVPFTQEDKVYNLFDVREETLYLGEPQLFQSPTEGAQRPTSVKLEVPFTKK